MNTPPEIVPTSVDPNLMATRYGIPYEGGIYGETSSHGLLEPRRILRVVVKKWLTIVLVLLFAGTAAAYYLLTTPKVYQAESLVELSVRRPRLLTQQAAVIEEQAGASQSEEIFNTRLEKFKGRTMMLAALNRLFVVYPAAFGLSGTNTAGTLSDVETFREKGLSPYQHGLKLTLLRRTRLVRVVFENTDPALAAAACNAFAEAAEASAYDENRISSDAAVVWLEAQAESQRKELLKSDDLLLKFRQEHKIDVLDSQRKTVENALLDFNKSLVDIESREACERDLLSTLEGLDLNPERAGELPAGIPRAEEISLALGKWRAAIAERDNLLTQFTPQHPEVKAKDRGVALHRSQALEALARAKSTTQSNCELLTKQAASLRQKKAGQAQLASELELQIIEGRTRLAGLERSRDSADQSYRGILTRIQDARMAADENTATIKLVEKAAVPAVPVKPRPIRVLALAILLGLMAGGGLALITDAMEDHATSPDDFNGSDVPILAVVPHAKTTERAAVATSTIHQRFSQITEAYAGLRAMLDSPQHKDRSQVVLIASSVPGEGKTVTSCNLAASWAKRGRRVLLVDFDLRRPRLAGIFSMPSGQRGLLEALDQDPDGSSMANLSYPVAECPGLHVIASRPFNGASPAEVVGTPAVAALISWARAHYDHVVLDAPPLGLVSDALALAPLVDCTLVMARPETSRKQLTWHTIRRFRESGHHSLALVINDVDYSRAAYGSYDPYYYYHRNYQAYTTEESAET
jgi:succinoglycan biosynthesis transport protein ExoP